MRARRIHTGLLWTTAGAGDLLRPFSDICIAHPMALIHATVAVYPVRDTGNLGQLQTASWVSHPTTVLESSGFWLFGERDKAGKP